ncbi:MAG: phage terminase large subunit family protein [Asticcacaulis sp.]|nr:phage terminase large subunit family protein [Asticcacaulis sp.]
MKSRNTRRRRATGAIPSSRPGARGDGHDDFKCLWTSTPKELPNCRISALYDEGDQRKYYAQCPHCREFQVLLFENILPPDRKGGRVSFACISGNGCVIDEIHKPFMLGQGRYWIRCYPSDDPENPAPPDHFPEEDLAKWRARPSEGRNPSFWAWQAYSKLKSWTKIFAEYLSAKKDVETGIDPKAMKVFYQQKLGLAWKPVRTRRIHRSSSRRAAGSSRKRGIIPAWACDVFLACDCQGDRIEWDAYAVGPDLAFARFDWGVIGIDPLENEAWAELAAVIARTGRVKRRLTSALTWSASIPAARRASRPWSTASSIAGRMSSRSRARRIPTPCP